MSGLRILNVHPRLIGSLADWSGLSAPDGQPWLLQHAREMGFNALWFNPLTKTTEAVVERAGGRKLTGSLYAATDHFAFDPEFSAKPAEADKAARAAADDEHIRHFTAQAAAQGITVMADMVFNHVAADHPLVTAETAQIEAIRKKARNIAPVFHNDTVIGMRYDQGAEQGKTLHFKFSRNRDFSLLFHKTDIETWDDVAQVNYDSPAGVDYFVKGADGQPGYWKQVIDWHIDRGFTGFRCDVAYKIPPAVWVELVQHAHDHLPEAVFMAETIGDYGMADALKNATVTVNGKEEKAFDLAMLPLYWWNFRDHWIIDENRRLQDMSRYGGAGFPDNHDTEHTIASYALSNHADHRTQDELYRTTAAICLRNYAVSALLCNSVYMQMGYELCRRQVPVFADPSIRQYWKDIVAERGDKSHPLNLTDRIRAINDFKAQLDDARAIVRFDNISSAGPGGRLVKVECTLMQRETGAALGKMVLCLNEKPELGPLRIREEDLGQDVSEEKMKRLILGCADDVEGHIYDIHDCAAYYTPSAMSPGLRSEFTARTGPANDNNGAGPDRDRNEDNSEDNIVAQAAHASSRPTAPAPQTPA